MLLLDVRESEILEILEHVCANMSDIWEFEILKCLFRFCSVSEVLNFETWMFETLQLQVLGTFEFSSFEIRFL